MHRIDLTAIGSVDWLRTPTLSSSGIWSVNSKSEISVGVVLLATYETQIAVVRKADVKGYEFSKALALPGGIVRGAGTATFTECVELTILLRAEDEAGLAPEALSDFAALSPRAVPVTRYTVKGVERFTAVLAVHASLKEAVQLVSGRKSIQESFFAAPPLDWKAFALANRLILAKALADSVKASERAKNMTAIDEALAFCNQAARAVDLLLLSHPWR